MDRELLCTVARTSLRTKLIPEVRIGPRDAAAWRPAHPDARQLADLLTEAVTDAVLTIRRPEQPIDLHMVEIMHVRGVHREYGTRQPLAHCATAPRACRCSTSTLPTRAWCAAWCWTTARATPTCPRWCGTPTSSR